ncbi:MAG: TRAP transporter large permease, partial [Gammaproteobacteria bacterium]|nr:TRAP transporter large permease [Gammaproteobacteria bacterium]
MLAQGYPKSFGVGVIATSGSLGILIPPSIVMIIYAVSTSESAGKLFIAGIVPGLLLAGCLMLVTYLTARRRKLPTQPRVSAAELWIAFRESLWGLVLVVIIMGGIYGGVFTPTEAAAAACGYALIYGLASGRADFVRNLVPTALRALNLTAVVMFLVGCVGVFQFLAANLYWPQKITEIVTGWGLTPIGFTFAFMGVLLLLGMFVDGVAMVLLTVPVVFPVAYALEIDPIHLGIMLALAVEMSVVTPPVGLNLFAVSGTAKIPVTEVVKGSVPFFLGDFIVLLLVIFFPVLAIWLPNLLVKSVFN